MMPISNARYQTTESKGFVEMCRSTMCSGFEAYLVLVGEGLCCEQDSYWGFVSSFRGEETRILNLRTRIRQTHQH